MTEQFNGYRNNYADPGFTAEWHQRARKPGFWKRLWIVLRGKL